MSIITPLEFAHLFSLCKPPAGWGRSITLALSGGPDSLCLLFLLHRHLSSAGYPPLRSITIDHALQPTSHASAHRTHARAMHIGVPNRILSAEWGTKPGPGAAVEEAARRARYKALWRGAWDSDTPGSDHDHTQNQTLMFAHHADDQLETVIMRIMRNTAAYGMGGMRAVRRWGMGEQGLKGMRTWICRPLLNVSKERILATCHAHNLSYEQDLTNFMPDLTIRNAIRHALSQPRQTPTDPRIRDAIERMGVLAGGNETETMRNYVRKMAEQVVQTDRMVDAFLESYTLPSPPSTLLLVPPVLTFNFLPQDAQMSLIHRILRYVSPHPWGSPSSEANRRSDSIHRIIQRVLQSSDTSNAKPFAAGAQVLWTPVFTRPDGTIRWQGGDGMLRGWLASRQPPLKGITKALEVDVKGSPEGAGVLWDNRFWVHVPGAGHKCQVVIRPKGRLILPEVVQLWEDGEEETLECQTKFVRQLDAI